MSEHDTSDEAAITERQRRAAARMEQARGAWALYRVATDQTDSLRLEIARLERELPSWTPLADKADLLEARSELAELLPERARAFGALLVACHLALTQDPDCAEARDLLADAHFTRFVEAETTGNVPEQVLHGTQLQAWDDGRYTAILRGAGSITLNTDPPDAEVLIQRFDQRGLVWTLSPPALLGRTPLVDAPLDRGSYLLTLRSPGLRDTRYPVFLRRGQRWTAGPPVPLHSDADIGPDCVYVPPGASGRDGFFLQRQHVTMQEYCAFLDAIPGRRWPLPTDRSEDRWDPRWPALGVTWDDAAAYAAWRAERDGLAWSLPTEAQWDKAARGADGRGFPWGDTFDATLALVSGSGPGGPAPGIVGASPTDVSIYGVRDLAGSARDWCGDAAFDGDPTLRPVRGGGWTSLPSGCHLGRRRSLERWSGDEATGFRLARPAR